MMDTNSGFTIREAILEKVENGIKGVELVTEIAVILYKTPEAVPLDMANFIINTLNDMVKEGEIIEIEYTLPHMPERIKSFYLPKGSKIMKRNGIFIYEDTGES